jgi:hypothetical protein
MPRSEADELIRRWVDEANSDPTPEERARVLQHIADAPFEATRLTAAEWSARRDDGELDAPINVIGEPHPETGVAIGPDTVLDSLAWHVAKRVRGGHWRAATTPAQYRDDLRRATLHAQAALHVGRRGHLKAAVLMEQHAYGLNTRAEVRRDRYRRLIDGLILVVYDAEKGCLVTGYTGARFQLLGAVKKWQGSILVPR